MLAFGPWTSTSTRTQTTTDSITLTHDTRLLFIPPPPPHAHILRPQDYKEAVRSAVEEYAAINVWGTRHDASGALASVVFDPADVDLQRV